MHEPRAGRDFFSGEGWKVPHMPSLVKGFRKQVPHMACLRQQQKFHWCYPISSCWGSITFPKHTLYTHGPFGVDKYCWFALSILLRTIELSKLKSKLNKSEGKLKLKRIQKRLVVAFAEGECRESGLRCVYGMRYKDNCWVLYGTLCIVA